jgi:hypothetical protein
MSNSAIALYRIARRAATVRRKSDREFGAVQRRVASRTSLGVQP